MGILRRAVWTARFLVVISISIAVASANHALGQSLGYGASPGRAGYRPSDQWNNGPFYTALHVEPYAPHLSAATNLYRVEPLAPPWSTAPHGLYGPYYPGRGVLHPYEQGFSPYSGFSNWYVRAYGVDPSREVVQRSRALFFRSAPRPPEGVLPPLPPARPVTIAFPQPRGFEARVSQTLAPAEILSRPRSNTIRVYRSSVAGKF